jgi:dihydrofolate reductase
MGELHVNMNITLDGVIQANGGPTEQDGDFEYAGWERPFWDAESGEQINADVRASDALLLGRTTYDIFRGYWPGKIDEIGRAFDRVPKVRRVPRHARTVLGHQSSHIRRGRRGACPA